MGDISGGIVEDTMAGAGVGDETGGAPVGSLVLTGDVSITVGDNGDAVLGPDTSGSGVGAFCAEGDRVTGSVVGADSRGVVEGCTAGGEVSSVKEDGVGNTPPGAVVLTGCVVGVNGGENEGDAGAALEITSGPEVGVT